MNSLELSGLHCAPGRTSKGFRMRSETGGIWVALRRQSYKVSIEVDTGALSAETQDGALKLTLFKKPKHLAELFLRYPSLYSYSSRWLTPTTILALSGYCIDTLLKSRSVRDAAYGNQR